MERVGGCRQDVGWWVMNALKFGVDMAAAAITIFVNSRAQHLFPRSYSHLRLAVQENGEVELVWVSFGAGNADFWR
jgi:hypothetical protein